MARFEVESNRFEAPANKHIAGWNTKPGLLGAWDRSSVIRFASSVFVRFTRFKGEYWVYLTEKRVKWAGRGDAKMVAGLLSQAPMMVCCLY